MSLSAMAVDRLRAMRGTLHAEADEARNRRRAMVEGASSRELEQRGVWLRRAVLMDVMPGIDKTRLVLGEDPNRKNHLRLLHVRIGGVLQLMPEDPGETIGIVVHRTATAITVEVEGRDDDWPDVIDGLVIDDVITIRRLQAGLDAVDMLQGRRASLAEMILGVVSPGATRRGPVAPRWFDDALNDDQREAVMHGMFAPDIAAIHGPPGTGKTRVVAEVVRQCVARGERVLALTSSHAAIDHLAECLLEGPSPPVITRIGEPARVQPTVVARTLQHQLRDHPHAQQARTLFAAAGKLRRTAERRSDGDREAYLRRREARDEAKAMISEARGLERTAARDVMHRTQVLCGTLTGSFATYAREDFSVLVVDEASQVLTPALLLALPHIERIVLAGDHRQLPPVVLSRDAADAGLSSTVFAELAELASWPTMSHQLLVQHRMRADLMAFPSHRFYGGKLRAHADMANRLLSCTLPWPHADAAFDFIDTAGASLNERSDGNDDRGSTANPAEAEVVARLVRSAIDAGLPATAIAVITPYAAQASCLRDLLAADVGEGLEIDTVDGFQGREKAMVLFSAVRSNDEGRVGFLADVRRLNVAITRAQAKLVMVGDSATLGTDPTWSAMIDHAIAAGCHRSVFEFIATG